MSTFSSFARQSTNWILVFSAAPTVNLYRFDVKPNSFALYSTVYRNKKKKRERFKYVHI